MPRPYPWRQLALFVEPSTYSKPSRINTDLDPYTVTPPAQIVGQLSLDLTLAERLGISRAQVQKARIEGLTELQADEWAIALGYHPLLIWPEWANDPLDAEGSNQPATHNPRKTSHHDRRPRMGEMAQ